MKPQRKSSCNETERNCQAVLPTEKGKSRQRGISELPWARGRPRVQISPAAPHNTCIVIHLRALAWRMLRRRTRPSAASSRSTVRPLESGGDKELGHGGEAPSGKWQAQVRMRNGAARSRTFSTRADALKWARETERGGAWRRDAPRHSGAQSGTLADGADAVSRQGCSVAPFGPRMAGDVLRHGRRLGRWPCRIGRSVPHAP